jgi:hypothetical protein
MQFLRFCIQDILLQNRCQGYTLKIIIDKEGYITPDRMGEAAAYPGTIVLTSFTVDKIQFLPGGVENFLYR